MWIIKSKHFKTFFIIISLFILANCQLKEPKQVKQHISYGRYEAPRLLKMEDKLMEHFGYNRSQLHKVLVCDAYSKMSLL